MSTDTSKWKLNHTMLRVKEPRRSIDFYNFLGLTQINKLSMPDAKFDLYFLAYDGPSSCSPGHHWTDRQGVLELTHNYGTEDDAEFRIANGNEDPGKGFGHVAISVDNIQAACRRLEEAGYPFQKRLNQGTMRSLAIAKDPDGYFVALVPQNPPRETEDMETTDIHSYRLNHSMLRVKDAEASLQFYQEVMGMKLMWTLQSSASNFNSYFLGYGDKPQEADNAIDMNLIAGHEGILELTWNYGTEKVDGQVYHNGNADPQGFGHICIAVDELNAACRYLDDKKVSWKKRLTDGRMKTVAFVLDPDSYWIEIIQNERLKSAANW